MSENPEDAGKTQIIIAKHRNGSIADVPMMFRASEVRFVDNQDSLVNQAAFGAFDEPGYIPASDIAGGSPFGGESPFAGEPPFSGEPPFGGGDFNGGDFGGNPNFM